MAIFDGRFVATVYTILISGEEGNEDGIGRFEGEERVVNIN